MKEVFDIQFVQSKLEIPTELKLIVNEKYIVKYRQVDCDTWGDFAYRFDIYCDDDDINYDKLVTAIVRKMESQSYDHGAQWRETLRYPIDNERHSTYVSIVVQFYIRDAG